MKRIKKSYVVFLKKEVGTLTKLTEILQYIKYQAILLMYRTHSFFGIFLNYLIKLLSFLPKYADPITTRIHLKKT